jgi:hypothetical protein
MRFYMMRTTAGTNLLLHEVKTALTTYGMIDSYVRRVKLGQGVSLTWGAFEDFAKEGLIDMSCLDQLKIEGDGWVIEQAAQGWGIKIERSVEEREE